LELTWNDNDFYFNRFDSSRNLGSLFDIDLECHSILMLRDQQITRCYVWRQNLKTAYRSDVSRGYATGINVRRNNSEWMALVIYSAIALIANSKDYVHQITMHGRSAQCDL